MILFFYLDHMIKDIFSFVVTLCLFVGTMGVLVFTALMAWDITLFWADLYYALIH